MNAIIFKEEGMIEYVKRDKPSISSENEVLVKVAFASICGSDLKILEVPSAHPAKKGVILGHEFCGIVADKGDHVLSFDIGDHVVIEPNIPCGECIFCKKDLPHMCERMETIGETLDGGFSEFCVVPQSQLHKLNNDSVLTNAAFIEPLTCVLGALKRFDYKIGDNGVVIGAGPLGFLFAEIFKNSGVDLTLIDISEERLNVARENGFKTLNAKNLELKKYFRNKKVDFVIDAVGSMLSECLEIISNGGSIVLFGVNDKSNTNISQFDITRKNLKVIGSFIGYGDFPQAIEIINKNIINVNYLISDIISLSNFEYGLQQLREKKSIKVLIDCQRG